MKGSKGGEYHYNRVMAEPKRQRINYTYKKGE
jgi:hypothetical protein